MPRGTGRRSLEPYERLFKGTVGPEFIFMNDNAQAHGVLMVDEYLESEDIQTNIFPSYSPDLNPIERAWDALGRPIALHQPPPRTILELKIALVEEFEVLLQALLNSLIPRLKWTIEALRSQQHGGLKGD